MKNTTRYYYGVQHSSFSMNDSAEKIREWGTADIFRFDSKAARDAWASESVYNVPCSAKYAKKCGVCRGL